MLTVSILINDRLLDRPDRRSHWNLLSRTYLFRLFVSRSCYHEPSSDFYSDTRSGVSTIRRGRRNTPMYATENSQTPAARDVMDF